MTLSLPLRSLRLYTRRGCCLCEGLQERLEALDPAPSIEAVDVDGDAALQARYGLRVPVLAVPLAEGLWRDLPPVPPRLGGERLARWLEGVGAVAGAAAPGHADGDRSLRHPSDFDAASTP